jgi:hypothetical protein
MLMLCVCGYVTRERERERVDLCVSEEKNGNGGGLLSQLDYGKLKGKECERETIQKSKRNRRERRAGVTLIYQKKKKNHTWVTFIEGSRNRKLQQQAIHQEIFQKHSNVGNQ